MKFSELKVGDKFKLGDIEFLKIEPEKVSCCRTNNALRIEDNTKTMVKADTQVETVQING